MNPYNYNFTLGLALGFIIACQLCMVMMVAMFLWKHAEWKRRLKKHLDAEEAEIRRKRGL